MKKHGPVNVIFYYPKTKAGKEELARRVAEVHADAVIRRIKALNCPTSQKLELLDAVIATAKQRAAKKESSDQENAYSPKDTPDKELSF